MGSDSDVPIGRTFTESRSVAVMPFDDLSEPPAPHLAQAVDTGLSTDLARLADTLVTPRGSAAALGTSASVDPKRVARELGVCHVVTGTVRRDGERLHVTAQLVRTEDGALLWADRFAYSSAADWLEQRDISARIANLLDLRMRDAVLQQARNSPPSSQAVDHWMRGAYILSRLRTKAELLQAREHFQTALALQPDSAHALAGLAMTHVEAVLYRWTDQRELASDTGARLARQALAIDPQNQDAMVALAGALIGSAIATVMIRIFGRIARNMDGTPLFELALDPWLYASSVLGAILFGVLAAAAPARRAARLDPAQAIRM